MINDLTARAALLARGFGDGELRRMRRTRRLTTVRPGAYLPAADTRLTVPESRHLLLVASTVPKLCGDAVVSHVSAAVLHGLPVWGIRLHRVTVTRNRRGGARRSGVAHVHAAGIEADEVVDVGGVAVTSVARTIVDLARSEPFEQAVSVADAALHRRLATPRELAAAVERAAHRPGNPDARRVVRFADGRSESPGESRSRVAIARAGLPAPVLQWEARSAEGVELGRVDFWWEEQQTCGEFDGRVKYGRLLRPGQEPGEAVWEEKRREDALRDTGRQVVRWVWGELHPFGVVARRLQRAFDRS